MSHSPDDAGWLRVLQALAETRRQHGLRATLCDMADRVGRRLTDLVVSYLFCYELGSNMEVSPPDSGFTFRFLTPGEIRHFAADPTNELDASLADRAAVGRDLCFGVLAETGLAGYGWCALRSIEGEHTGGVVMSYPADVAYMYKGFTRPEYRGQRLNGLRMAFAGRELVKRGVRQLLALVDWTNWSSIQSCRRSGCAELGRVVKLTWAGRDHWWFPESARRLGIRFGEEATT